MQALSSDQAGTILDVHQAEKLSRDIEMTRTAARARKGDPGCAAKQSPADSSGRSRFSDVRKRQQEEGAARIVTRFDPHKDYYKILGVDHAATWREVKAAYKRLALSLHPDKQRRATPDQAAAVAQKFLEVAEANDVLTNEEQRAAYDKIRDYMDAHPGMGVPTLSPQQAAMMQKGLSELVQMRRKGLKAQKHRTSVVPLPVSLEKLNSGCIRTVSRERSRVDGCGLPCKDIKTFHVVITRGSQPGQKHVMEDEADETADTAAGDLVFVLQQKPHAKLRRSGVKNLEYVARSSMQKGHTLFGESVCGIYGRSFLVTANFFLEAAAHGGKGSTCCHVLTGEGLYDPADPWGQPKGDMIVKVRVPPLPQRWTLQCSPKPVHLVRDSQDSIMSAAVSLWESVCAYVTPRDTLGVSAQNAEPVIRVGGSFRQIIVKLGVQFQRKAFAEFKIRVIVIAVVQKELGVAAATMMTCSLTASGSGLQWRVIDLYLDSQLNHSDCAAKGSSSCTIERRDCNTSGEIQPSSAVDGASWSQQLQGGLSEVLLDDEWKALEEAQVVVWDLAEELQQSEQWLSLSFSAVPGNGTSGCSWKHRP
ncbi:TPA: hypothetical protein ACH3X2_002409 [Trebouxia sp. C0005]